MIRLIGRQGEYHRSAVLPPARAACVDGDVRGARVYLSRRDQMGNDCGGSRGAVVVHSEPCTFHRNGSSLLPCIALLFLSPPAIDLGEFFVACSEAQDLPHASAILQYCK